MLRAGTELRAFPCLTQFRRPRGPRESSSSSSRRHPSCVRPCASRRMPRTWSGSGWPVRRQSLQSPSSLAFSRRSLAAFLEASLRSGGDCLWASRPPCSSGVLSTFGGRTLFGGLGFGSDLGLVFPGFVNRRRSPGFSRVGVGEGLLARSYLPLNLAGSGTRSRKVAPTARFCGEPAGRLSKMV